MPKKNNPKLIVASVFAILIIGASFWYTQLRNQEELPVLTEENSTEVQRLDRVRPIQTDDHIRGNPDAKLVYVVYSDFACPFCKDYHNTMKLIVSQFGKNGDVAWVFRHMPIVQLHPRSPIYALASECVAQKGGNTAFWNFADALFEAVKPDEDVSAEELITLAQKAGVDKDEFTACMDSDELTQGIQDDFDEIVMVGAKGTPFTVVITPAERATIAGIRPFVPLASVTKTMLRTVGATSIESPDSAGSPGDQFMDDLTNSKARQTEQTSTSSALEGTTPGTTTNATAPAE
jgi:protein-disulfide isomerase